MLSLCRLAIQLAFIQANHAFNGCESVMGKGCGTGRLSPSCFPENRVKQSR